MRPWHSGLYFSGLGMISQHKGQSPQWHLSASSLKTFQHFEWPETETRSLQHGKMLFLHPVERWDKVQILHLITSISLKFTSFQSLEFQVKLQQVFFILSKYVLNIYIPAVITLIICLVSNWCCSIPCPSYHKVTNLCLSFCPSVVDISWETSSDPLKTWQVLCW